MRNALQAFLFLVPSIGLANELPQQFPDEATEKEKILHCAAVSEAHVLALLVGSNIAEAPHTIDEMSTSMFADWFAVTLGGRDVIEKARTRALDWEENWKSNGRTFWSAMLSHDSSTPYNVWAGQLLVEHHFACVEFFQTLAQKYNRDIFSTEKRTVTLPFAVSN